MKLRGEERLRLIFCDLGGMRRLGAGGDAAADGDTVRPIESAASGTNAASAERDREFSVGRSANGILGRQARGVEACPTA